MGLHKSWQYMFMTAILILTFSVSSKGQTVVFSIADNPVIEFNDFAFNCTNTDNNGPPIISLNDGDTTSELYQRIMQTTVGSEVFATLQNVTRDENGTRFVCRIGSSEQVQTLIVHYPSSYNELSTAESRLFDGSYFSFNLSYVEGFPISTFSWTKDGQPFEETENEGVILSVDSITIASINVSDYGTYTVTAENTAGMSSASIRLFVYFGPYLVAGNNDSVAVNKSVGENFTVDCTVSSSSPDIVSLYLERNNGTQTNRTNVLDNPITSLIDLAPSDSGTYRCIANSGAASTKFKYLLNVISPQPTQTPVESPTAGSLGLGCSVLLLFMLLLLATYYNI